MRPDLSQLAHTQFDLVVVGGGIHGAAVARDAASRRLKVALFEKDDFGASTSGATSKLVHGGLRYLEHLHLRLVRESLRERDLLLRSAPHLVRPLPFLMPLTPQVPHPQWKLSVGLTFYDLLARGGSLGRHQKLSVDQVLEREPHASIPDLNGALLFHDAQMNDARLVLENCLAARAEGAEVWNQVEVTGLDVRHQRVHGVLVRDRQSSQVATIPAGVVVNASGPWLTQVESLQKLTEPSRVRLSRGTHIVVPALTQGHALLLHAHADGRVFFVLPWKGQSLVGTTEIEHETGPDDIRPTEAEIQYLLNELKIHFPRQAPSREAVLAVFAGVRTLPGVPQQKLGSLPRRAQIRLEAPGLLGILGGKFTTHRATAELVVDRVLHLLQWSFRKSTTADQNLPGGDIPDMNDYFRVAEDVLVKKYGVDVRILRYWVGTYGTRHTQLLKLLEEDPALADPIEAGHPFTPAEVIHAVREEWALTVEDLIWRRTYRGYAGPLGREAIDAWEAALDRAKAEFAR